MCIRDRSYLNENELKMGVYLPLLRIMMCGKLTGPDLFEMMKVLEKDEVSSRMDAGLSAFKLMEN